MSASMLATHQLQCLAMLANIATGRPPKSAFKLLAVMNRKSLRHLYGPRAEDLIESANHPPTPWPEIRAKVLQAPGEALASLIFSADYQCCETPSWTHSEGRRLLMECLWMITASEEWRKP